MGNTCKGICKKHNKQCKVDAAVFWWGKKNIRNGVIIAPGHKHLCEDCITERLSQNKKRER